MTTEFNLLHAQEDRVLIKDQLVELQSEILSPSDTQSFTEQMNTPCELESKSWMAEQLEKDNKSLIKPGHMSSFNDPSYQTEAKGSGPGVSKTKMKPWQRESYKRSRQKWRNKVYSDPEKYEEYKIKSREYKRRSREKLKDQPKPPKTPEQLRRKRESMQKFRAKEKALKLLEEANDKSDKQ